MVSTVKQLGTHNTHAAQTQNHDNTEMRNESSFQVIKWNSTDSKIRKIIFVTVRNAFVNKEKCEVWVYVRVCLMLN